MQIGVISDIHGNEAAFDTTVDELRRLGVDEIICLGDAVDPLPGSEKVFRSILAQEIPFIRGNHEDYIVLASDNALDPAIADAKFKPVHLAAQSFSSAQIEQLRSLPLSITKEDPKAGEIFFCHASPLSNRQGWKNGDVDPLIKEDLEQINAPVLVAGHWHLPGEYERLGKTLISVGSIGIPFNPETEAEFLVLEATTEGWRSYARRIPYDVQKTLQDYYRSGWLKQGAPISLLYFWEIATGHRSLAPLFHWKVARGLEARTLEEWKTITSKYLQETGRWTLIEQKLAELSLPKLSEILY